MAATTRAQRGFPRIFSTASFSITSFIFACCQTGPSRAELQHLRLPVVTDRVTGYSKGLGFGKYATLEDGTKGIGGMHGKFLDSWVIFAEYARPRPPASQAQINGFPLNRRP